MILKCFTLFKKGTQPYVRVHFCQRMIAFVPHRESLQRSSTKCCVICSAHRYRLPTLEYQRTLSVHVKHSLCSSTSIIKGSQQRTSVAFGGQCFSQVVISSKKKKEELEFSWLLFNYASDWEVTHLHEVVYASLSSVYQQSESFLGLKI